MNHYVLSPGHVKEKKLKTNSNALSLSKTMFNIYGKVFSKEMKKRYFLRFVLQLSEKIDIEFKDNSQYIKLIVKNGENLLNIDTEIAFCKKGELTLLVIVTNFEKVCYETLNSIVNSCLEEHKKYLDYVWFKNRDEEYDRLLKMLLPLDYYQTLSVESYDKLATKSHIILDNDKVYYNNVVSPLFVTVQSIKPDVSSKFEQSSFMIQRLKMMFMNYPNVYSTQYNKVPLSIISVIIPRKEDVQYKIALKELENNVEHSVSKKNIVYTQSLRCTLNNIYSYYLPNILILSKEKKKDLEERIEKIEEYLKIKCN